MIVRRGRRIGTDGRKTWNEIGRDREGFARGTARRSAYLDARGARKATAARGEARDSRVEPAMDARGRRRRVGPRRRRRLLKGRRGGRSTVGGWLAARREGEARGASAAARGRRRAGGGLSYRACRRTRESWRRRRRRACRVGVAASAPARALSKDVALSAKFHISQQPPKASSLECVTFVFVCVSVTCTSYWFDSSANTSRVRRASAAAARGGEARARPRCFPPSPSHPTSPRAL